MTDDQFVCMVCRRSAQYDQQKGYVACSGCGENYFDGCTCQPQEPTEGKSNG